MRKMIIRFFALFLSLLFLCSCAAKPDRASAEEAEKLKQMYPYNDRLGIYPLHPQDERFPDLETWIAETVDEEIAAVVVLEFTSDFYQIGYYESLNGDEEVEERIRRMQVEDPMVNGAKDAINATVEQVLWTSPYEDNWHGKKLTAGDGITLSAGNFGWHYEPTFFAGNRCVCILTDRRCDGAFSDELSVFTSSPYATFHLSNDDILLSATSAPGQDECTGMYLYVFEKLIKENMDKQYANME